MLISEGVGRAHHGSTMETAGAAARRGTNSPGIIDMQRASRWRGARTASYSILRQLATPSRGGGGGWPVFTGYCTLRRVFCTYELIQQTPVKEEPRIFF